MGEGVREQPGAATAAAAAAAAPATGAGAGTGRLVLNVTSDPANLAPARRACEAFCREIGLDDAACADVGLCVNEAMANVTRHAYGGATDRPVSVSAEATAGPGVRITIRDWGSGVNPLATAPKCRDPLQPGGLGLICLRQLLDEVRFDPQPDGMLLTMGKWRKVGS